MLLLKVHTYRKASVPNTQSPQPQSPKAPSRQIYTGDNMTTYNVFRCGAIAPSKIFVATMKTPTTMVTSNINADPNRVPGNGRASLSNNNVAYLVVCRLTLVVERGSNLSSRLTQNFLYVLIYIASRTSG